MGGICLAWCCGLALAAAEAPVRSDQPTAVTFPAEEAKFVRFVIRAASSGSPCLDELEVYGPDGKRNLALAKAKDGAKATASSCLTGYAKHQIAHLNDGRYGNEYSWIAAGTEEEWAQIELPSIVQISKVVFSRDRNRQYADRVPIHFAVQLSLDGVEFEEVKEVVTTAAPVAVRRRYGSFAGVVPGAPPPPSVMASGQIVLAEAPANVEVPENDEQGFPNLALNPRAKPAASSFLPGHAIHQVAHLNDGLAGNEHSWISKEDPSWAEIDLGDVYWVYQVAFASDNSRRYGDRAAAAFSILTAVDYNEKSSASTWSTVHRQTGGSPVHTRQAFRFQPVQARWVRLAVEASSANEVRIDEIEVFGQKDAIPAERIGPIPEPALAESETDMASPRLVRQAFLDEEHAWLKTYGRADLDRRLTETPYREKRYPSREGEDRLPLGPLSGLPRWDGHLADSCWNGASRGEVRVARPNDFEQGPLVTTTVWAGRTGDDLVLAIHTDRLLSSHLAVVSSADGRGCGVVAFTNEGLVFNTYEPDGRAAKLKESVPIEGAIDKSLTSCELRLPLDWFPECEDQGIRVGLGMGGKHTLPEGRAVNFVFASLSVAEISPCADGTFRVRLSAAPGTKAVRLQGTAPGLADGITLAPGESMVLSIPAEEGPIGSQYDLKIDDDAGNAYVAHLFRYDPLGRTLSLLAEMIGRFEAKGLDVAHQRRQLAEFIERHAALLAADTPDPAAERQAFFEARLAKRRLFLKDPDLSPIEDILFVKRHAFEPSHNYSVILDSRFRPGGGVYTIHIPRREGRFRPEEATLNRLFDAAGGIPRNPMVNFDLTKIYFGYRPAEDDYYHLMSVAPDGGEPEQLTFGPFHDYWPCPLPDGGLAFISTRCRARFLCWRPQAAVLFRMDANGENIRPLSFANLTEWGPSVMSDGRIIWQRSEYIDKGADYSHTLWSIRPDGSKPELVFGNTILLPQGYANGREVPGTNEICCTLISHFGDLNGPIALVDTDKGRFNPEAIRSITPEVPWPGAWPREECFRDPFPIARDYFLLSHAPRDRFGLFVIDRYGNRELLYMDETFGSMCPTVYRKVKPPPVLSDLAGEASEHPEHNGEEEFGEFFLANVYQGLLGNSDLAQPGSIKYLRVVEEVRSNLTQLPDGSYRKDHDPFMHWYAAPVDKVRGPFGWPSYVAKATWGVVPVEADGSARFYAPAGKQLYFQVLDEDYNEVQRMRSVVQVRPGERRSCVGCHDDRRHAPPAREAIALRNPPRRLEPPPWGAGAFSYEQVVQPILDAKCASCHDAADKQKIDLTGTLDPDRIPASYKTLILQGWVHHFDLGYQSGENGKAEPLTFGSVKSKLWPVLEAGHYDAQLTEAEMRAIKCWTDLNCPLWPDYRDRRERPATRQNLVVQKVTKP